MEQRDSMHMFGNNLQTRIGEIIVNDKRVLPPEIWHKGEISDGKPKIKLPMSKWRVGLDLSGKTLYFDSSKPMRSFAQVLPAHPLRGDSIIGHFFSIGFFGEPLLGYSGTRRMDGSIELSVIQMLGYPFLFTDNAFDGMFYELKTYAPGDWLANEKTFINKYPIDPGLPPGMHEAPLIIDHVYCMELTHPWGNSTTFSDHELLNDSQIDAINASLGGSMGFWTLDDAWIFI